MEALVNRPACEEHFRALDREYLSAVSAIHSQIVCPMRKKVNDIFFF